MAVFKSFSQREKKRLGEFADVFTYDEVPEPLRVQIVRIWERFLGVPGSEATSNNGLWKVLKLGIEEMLGIHDITIDPFSGDSKQIVSRFFRSRADQKAALDVIDFIASKMYDFERRSVIRYNASLAETIEDINTRFGECSLGYEIVHHGNQRPYLIRKDSEHLHHDVVLPALRLLYEEQFAGADDEYRRAHEHHRKREYDDCLVDCLKAFESTMKTICNQRGWTYAPSDRAKNLIEIVVKKGLFPTFIESHLTSIRSGLENGVPTIRNKMGGHGQGEALEPVPEHFSEYMLHETAAVLLLLVKAYKVLPPLA